MRVYILNRGGVNLFSHLGPAIIQVWPLNKGEVGWYNTPKVWKQHDCVWGWL